MNEPNKKIELEDLAGMVAKGFDSVDKRFDNVDKRFDKVDADLEEIKLKLDQVAYRFEVEELDRRLKIVEAKLGISGQKK